MSPVRGIPTSRAYWELKAEQVLNRVFEPEKPIEVEVCDTPALSIPDGASHAAASIPVELHDLATPAEPTQPRTHDPIGAGAPARSRVAQRSSPGARNQAGSRSLPRWIDQLGRQPSLLLAGASVTVMVVAGTALVVLGLWNQSQQAIRQERNMLLIERLRAMGPGTTASDADPAQHSAAAEAAKDGELPPPPP